jgi:SAM-dependent methyltransferase
MATGRLVEPRFWDEEYIWSGSRPPLRPDPALGFDRVLMRAIARWAAPSAGDGVIEIGCAPAKWLVHLAERYGGRVEGIEYTEKGAAFSRANLDACGVQGTIHHADFFTFEPREHDLVLSLGFIEHFDDLEGVFARHVSFVAPGGRLVLGVPNFRGLNRLLQRWSDPAYLALHNLRAMDPILWRKLAGEHGLEATTVRHIGGPDPVIVRLRGRLPTGAAMVEARFRRLRIADRLNHPWFSSYLFMVFARPS